MYGQSAILVGIDIKRQEMQSQYPQHPFFQFRLTPFLVVRFYLLFALFFHSLIMKFLAGLALASLAFAAPAVQKQRAPTPLDVKLELQGNSKVKAIITNHGKNNLKVLKSGTFLDNSAVEKAQVFSGGRS